MKKLKLNIQLFASTTIEMSQVSTSSSSANAKFQGKLECSSVANNNGNYSTVTVDLYCRKINTTIATTGSDWKGNITIDGATSAFTNAGYHSVNTEWVKIWTYSRDIYHNNDGSKSITISGAIKGPNNTVISNSNSTGSGTFVLDTIPRNFSRTPSITLIGKTENTMTYNWSTSETCSAITWNGGGTATITGLWGTSGTINVSNLTAGQYYNHYGTFTRSDSGLSLNSNAIYDKPYDYPTPNNMPNFTIEEQVVIGIINERAYNCTLYAIAKDNTELLIGTTTSNSITIPNSSTWNNFWYDSIPNSPTGTYKIRLICQELSRDITVNGGTYSINYETTKPVFSFFTYNDENETTHALTNDYSMIVPNHSSLRVSISPSDKALAQRGTTIVSYRVNSTLYNYADNFFSSLMTNYNINPLEVTAIDARGNEKTVSYDFISNNKWLDYTNITSNNLSYSRSASGAGSQVTFNFEGTFWNNNFGNQNNSITAKYKFKKTTDSDYGAEINIPSNSITINNNNYSFSGVLAGDGTDNGFEVDHSYSVIITVSDKLSSTTFTYFVVEGSPAIDLYGNCISLGGMYNETLGGRVQINGKKVEDVFSTNETLTNKIWINDKPIYKKTIYIDSLPSSQDQYYTKSYATNISNIEQVIDMYGQYQGIVSGIFTTRPLNFHISDTASANVATYIGSDNYIKIRTQIDQSNFSGYVTVEYTKTTD